MLSDSVPTCCSLAVACLFLNGDRDTIREIHSLNHRSISILFSFLYFIGSRIKGCALRIILSAVERPLIILSPFLILCLGYFYSNYKRETSLYDSRHLLENNNLWRSGCNVKKVVIQEAYNREEPQEGKCCYCLAIDY